MEKKKPFTAMLYIVIIFGLVALITVLSESSGMTGLAVLDVSYDTSLTFLGPIAIFGVLFSVGIIALHKISK